MHLEVVPSQHNKTEFQKLLFTSNQNQIAVFPAVEAAMAVLGITLICPKKADDCFRVNEFNTEPWYVIVYDMWRVHDIWPSRSGRKDPVPRRQPHRHRTQKHLGERVSHTTSAPQPTSNNLFSLSRESFFAHELRDLFDIGTSFEHGVSVNYQLRHPLDSLLVSSIVQLKRVST